MSKEDDEKIQVWKDEIAMHGNVISDEVKVKDFKNLKKDISDEEYQKFLNSFFKGKNE
jgi:hypothetical protein|tara:strand:- start:949 stop:1122 length:174 start_codon:yes stop_codon:yes gene_type:complete